MTSEQAAAAPCIWVVVPVYNNGRTVRAVAQACRAAASHVLVVDDGSTDTDVAAVFANTDIAVVRHEHNRGKGAAILTALAFLQARGGTHAITIDADGQHQAADLRQFLAAIAAHPDAIVVGARRMTGPNVPRASRFGRRISDFWVSLETGRHVHDTQSGFRAYPVALVCRLFLRARRYDFELEVLVKAMWAGLPVVNVDIDVDYQPPGERVTHFRPFGDNFWHTHRHILLLLRRLLPWPHRQLVAPAEAGPWDGWRHPGRFLRRLLNEHATPDRLGAAAAVGVFLGALPLVGVHTLVIVYVTTRLHLNRLMAVAAQNLCMPPFVPLVCVELGHRLRYGCWLDTFTYETVVRQAHYRLWEWLLGSLLIAPVLAALTDLLVYALAAIVARRMRRTTD